MHIVNPFSLLNATFVLIPANTNQQQKRIPEKTSQKCFLLINMQFCETLAGVENYKKDLFSNVAAKK